MTKNKVYSRKLDKSDGRKVLSMQVSPGYRALNRVLRHAMFLTVLIPFKGADSKSVGATQP